MSNLSPLFSILIGLCQAGPGSAVAPPIELYRVETIGEFILENTPDGRYVHARVTLSTGGKEIGIVWTAIGEVDALQRTETGTHTVSFFPTAACRSWQDPRSFYVAGRFLNSTMLEEWTLGSDYSLSVSVDLATGLPKTAFTPPTVSREPQAVDPAMQNVSSITVNPWPPSGTSEEIWLLEWETRDVWATNQSTGVRELRVSSSITAPYRRLAMRQHSVFGGVCMFLRSPDAGGDTLVADPTDTDFLVTYDQDLDGTIDGHEVITQEAQAQHPVWTTGTLTVP